MEVFSVGGGSTTELTGQFKAPYKYGRVPSSTNHPTQPNSPVPRPACDRRSHNFAANFKAIAMKTVNLGGVSVGKIGHGFMMATSARLFQSVQAPANLTFFAYPALVSESRTFPMNRYSRPSWRLSTQSGPAPEPSSTAVRNPDSFRRPRFMVTHSCSEPGEFYGVNPRTANLEVLNRFFTRYPEMADRTFLSVKVRIRFFGADPPCLAG